MKKFYIVTNTNRENDKDPYVKWAPIVQQFMDGTSVSFIRKIAEYAETHYRIENSKNYQVDDQTLSLAIKTLSKIDKTLCDINIVDNANFRCYDSLTGNYKDYEVQTAITRFDYDQNMFDIIPEYKNDIIDELSNKMVSYIDGLSHVSETIVIYQLFNELTMENGVAEIKSLMLNLSTSLI